MKTLVVGAAIVDQMMRIDQLPKSGDDIPCKETRTVIGGCAFNVASTLQNMEVEHDLCVPVGTGMYADMIRKELGRRGYPILLENEKEDNGYCLSLVEADGERTFITVTGAEGTFDPAALNAIDTSSYDRIYLAGYQAGGSSGEVLVEWLEQNRDKELYFAPGPMITEIQDELMQRYFALHPVIHINDKEAREYTGSAKMQLAAKILYEKTGNLVIITLGADGTGIYDGSEYLVIPSEKVSVKDTVGAGDSHIAAFIGSTALGRETAEAIAYANRVAGGIVGTQGPTMTKEEFDQKIGG